MQRGAAPAGPGALGSAGWLTLCAVLGFGALAGWWLPADSFDWQPQRAWVEPWRWFSAAWVHLDGQHLAANLAGVAVLAAFGYAAGCRKADAVAWLCAWPLTHGLLLLAPSLLRYAGLSGALHAGVAVSAFGLVSRERGGRRVVGALVLAGLLLKLLGEQPGVAPVRAITGWDFPVAVLAHATGAAAGIACAAVAWATSRRRAPATIGA